MSSVRIDVVELIDETDDLIGYGVCVGQVDDEGRTDYALLPAVHATRSEARTAALDERDRLLA